MKALSAGEAVLLASYLGCLGALALYAVHRLYLLGLLGRRTTKRLPPALSDVDSEVPLVTVQLPVMNERYVVERLIRSTAALDYPRARVEIQVLDDSADETTSIVARLCDELRADGLAIHHVHRPARDGFKAGALANGLASARGEILLILDADFVASPDLLRRTVPFFADPTVGMVQARWGHINRSASWMTRAQAAMLDGHFAVEHGARFAAGRFFNFNGTAGLFRRAAIEAAGGWHADTLTEDLDLSYRLQLAGYRGVYVEDVVVPGELPASVGALLSQQHRWAKGSMESCRKLLGTIWRSSAPLATKVEATFHLTANAAYLLLLLLSLLTLPTVVLRARLGEGMLLGIDLLFLFVGLVPLVAFYAEASRRTVGRRRLQDVPLVMMLGAGLAVNNSLAVVSGLAGLRSPFVRTPKTGGRAGPLAASYRPRRSLLFLAELGMAAWVMGAAMWAASTGNVAALPLPFLLGSGYLAVALASAAETLRRPLVATVPSSPGGQHP